VSGSGLNFEGLGFRVCTKQCAVNKEWGVRLDARQQLGHHHHHQASREKLVMEFYLRNGSSQGQNLALTVLCVPSLLGSGRLRKCACVDGFI